MKIVIDTAAETLTQVNGAAENTFGLYTKEAFEALSLAWVRVGWSLQYYHNFTWFGLPVLQLPEDMLRLQEVIYALRPAVLVAVCLALGLNGHGARGRPRSGSRPWSPPRTGRLPPR